MTGDLLIGTSGFDYPHWKKGVFYPERLPQSALLPYYAERFPTVELNAPFYRLPTAERFAHWRALTPPGFVFAVKASRYLTHYRQLLECEAPLALFMERAGRLGDKLGAVLFQLPPTFQANPARLEGFLEQLTPGPHWVFEFRHPSWLVKPVFALLRRHRACLCIPVGGRAGIASPEGTGPALYLRMHRGRGKEGNFTPAELRQWAEWIAAHRSGRTVYVYFNNDWQGFALRNASTLGKLLGVATVAAGSGCSRI